MFLCPCKMVVDVSSLHVMCESLQQCPVLHRVKDERQPQGCARPLSYDLKAGGAPAFNRCRMKWQQCCIQSEMTLKLKAEALLISTFERILLFM